MVSSNRIEYNRKIERKQRIITKHMPIVIHNDYMIIELPLFTSGARQSSNKLLHKSSCVVNEF